MRVHPPGLLDLSVSQRYEVTGVCLFEGVMRGDVAGVDVADGGPDVAGVVFGVLELVRCFGVQVSGKMLRHCSSLVEFFCFLAPCLGVACSLRFLT